MRGEEGLQKVCVTPTTLFRRMKSTGTAAKPWKRRRWIRSDLLPRFKTLQRKLQTDLVMFHAEHSIFLMSKIAYCWLMSLQSVCKSSRVINTARGKCKHSIFIYLFLAFLFSLTMSWWFAKLEKGGMQIPDFVTSFYHISSRKNWPCSWGFLLYLR